MTQFAHFIWQGIEFLLSFLFVSVRHSTYTALHQPFTQPCGFLRIDKVALIERTQFQIFLSKDIRAVLACKLPQRVLFLLPP